MIGLKFIITALEGLITFVVVGGLLILIAVVVLRGLVYVMDKLGVETGSFREWISSKIRKIADGFSKKNK